MIAVDTNVLLRLALGDNSKQQVDAFTLVEKAARDKIDVYINAVVLAEFGWTLKRLFGASRAEISTAILRFINCPPFRLFDDQVAQDALDLFEAGKADFGDCLISAINSAVPVKKTYSFDKIGIRSNVFAAI